MRRFFTKLDNEVCKLYEFHKSWKDALLDVCEKYQIDVSEVEDYFHPEIIEKVKKEVEKYVRF